MLLRWLKGCNSSVFDEFLQLMPELGRICREAMKASTGAENESVREFLPFVFHWKHTNSGQQLQLFLTSVNRTLVNEKWR